MAVVVQKIRKHLNNQLDVAIKYYTILSIINNLGLSERELQLIAFTAMRGNISSGGKKEEFITLFHSSKASIGNMIHKLGKQKIMQKVDGKTRVNPNITIDFSEGIILQIGLDGIVEGSVDQENS